MPSTLNLDPDHSEARNGDQARIVAAGTVAVAWSAGTMQSRCGTTTARESSGALIAIRFSAPNAPPSNVISPFQEARHPLVREPLPSSVTIPSKDDTDLPLWRPAITA